MFVNAYEFDVRTIGDDSVETTVHVSLRLSVGSQIKLKKKYNESTTHTIFNAVDDPERFADVVTEALKYKGNHNEIQSGEDLIDIMTANDMLGMVERQHILTAIGRASGLFSEKEQKRIDARAAKLVGDVLEDEEGDAPSDDNNGKN